MANRVVWTEEKLNEAARLWDAGVPSSKIAEAIGVTKGSMSGTASMRRDIFPARQWAKEPVVEKAAKTVPEPVIDEPPPRCTFIAGKWVEHVKRTTSTGAVVTMPRVSFIDGEREGAD